MGPEDEEKIQEEMSIITGACYQFRGAQISLVQKFKSVNIC